jgi:hypothetical protein
MNFIKKHYLLISIIILGAVLRFWGINFGLPYQFHQDEPMAINHAFGYGSGDFNSHYFQLPPFLSYVLFFIYGIIYIVGRVTHIFISKYVFVVLFLKNPTIFYLAARFLLGFVPSVLSIFLIYKLGKSIANKNTGLLSAFFLSVCFIHVRDSHYVYHDIPLSTCLLFSFIYIFAYLEKNKIAYLIKTGIAIGLATGFKYNGIFVMASICYLLFTAGNQEQKLIGRLKSLLIVAIVSFMAYAVSNPYSLLDAKNFLKSLLAEGKAHGYVGWLRHISYSSFEGLGIMTTIISLLGLAYFMLSRDKRKRSVALFVLLSYLSIVYFGQIHERYLLVVVPFLILMACVFIDRYLLKLVLPHRRSTVFVIIFVLCNALPLIKSIYADILFSRADTRAQATEWIIKHIPEKTSLVLDHPFFSPRLMQTPEQIDDKLRFLENKKETGARLKKAEILKQLALGNTTYNVFFLSHASHDKFLFSSFPTVNFEVKKLLDMGVKYIILHFDYPMQRYPDESFYNELLKQATLVKVFNPFRNEYFDLKEAISTTAAPFRTRELFARRQNGPVLVIYKL